MSTTSEATHPEPVWRESADFIIATTIDAATTSVTTEQLWARQTADFEFEICCIPFFAHHLALGDIVETDDSYLVKGVRQPSGRSVFRVWLGDSSLPREDFAREVEEHGGLLEWSSVNLVAIDVADAAAAQELADFLQDREKQNPSCTRPASNKPHERAGQPPVGICPDANRPPSATDRLQA